MVRVKSEDRLACEGCGHAASAHSNEACDAIRCSCRVTRKMLAKAAARPPAPRVAKPAPKPMPEPAKLPRKRARRDLDTDRTAGQGTKTEAA